MTQSKHDYDPGMTELASGFTVRDYESARNARDRDAIAEAIRSRFTERYIGPISSDASGKHGFATMALSCLMIETLESFRQGWETSNRQSKAAFCLFFDAAEPFKDFRGHVQAFYTHVRCGILHQAETTGGWRIRRSGPLLDPTALTINATRFLEALRQVLDTFCDSLKGSPWDDPVWKRVRTKMNAISKHCARRP